MELAFLNTTITTADGGYRLTTVTLDHVKKRVAYALTGKDRKGGIKSYVSHEATAALLSTLLGVDIECNRGLFRQQVGQSAVCFKLRGRFETGRELSLADIEEIGYEFKMLTRES